MINITQRRINDKFNEEFDILHKVDPKVLAAQDKGSTMSQYPLEELRHKSLFPNSKREIHSIFRYPAKLIPAIPLSYLNSKYLPDEGSILDPFVGSGTVLVEGQVKGYKGYGIDINPLSILLTKVKTTPVDWNLFHSIKSEFWSSVIEEDPDIPVFTNIEYWFEPQVQEVLGKILNAINQISNEESRDIFRLCFASIIRSMSNADPIVFPPVYSDKAKKGNINRSFQSIQAAFDERLDYIVKTLSNHLSTLVAPHIPEVKLGSATDPRVYPENLDLVITSPPYINAQKYLRTTKFELFWLGLLHERDKSELEREFIGTERLLRDDYSLLDNLNGQHWSPWVSKIREVDEYRALIAHKYFLDMGVTFENIYNSLKKNGKFILVMGNNSIRGIRIKNHEIMIEMAKDTGFSFLSGKIDPIQQRYLSTKRNETADFMRFEYVLIFSKD